MRSEEVLGRINYGEKVNEAYKTYASLYLDFVDDNYRHFFWRNHDIGPVLALEEKGENVEDEELVYQTYVNEAIEIAKDTISSGYWKSFKDLYEEYPLLRNYSEQLEKEIYED